MNARDDEIELVKGWMEAASRAEVAAGLEDVYAETSRLIAERGPACWASGRCCNFAKTGHLLYVTGLEAAYTYVRLVKPVTVGEVASAREAGGCPFQDRNLCGVHPIRPLGCRVYFCDRSAQSWQQDLYEQELARVRKLHDDHGVEYRYAEWRGLLEMLARSAG